MLTRWQCLVASMNAMNLLHWVMCTVMNQRITTAIKMASKVGVFFIVVLLIVALAAAGAMRSEKSPDDSVQWLVASSDVHCFNALT